MKKFSELKIGELFNDRCSVCVKVDDENIVVVQSCLLKTGTKTTYRQDGEVNPLEPIVYDLGPPPVFNGVLITDGETDSDKTISRSDFLKNNGPRYNLLLIKTRDNPEAWAISEDMAAKLTLNKKTENFDYMNPSSLTEDYLDNHRFSSPLDALIFCEKWKKRMVAKFLEEQ